MKLSPTALLAATLIGAGPALAQPEIPAPLAPSPAVSAAPTAPGSLRGREDALSGRLEAGVAAGAVTRAQADTSVAVLRNIRAQEDELVRRDGRLNETDRQFISDRLDRLTANVAYLQTPPPMSTAELGRAAPPPLLTETPEGLICPARHRTLLAVGRDEATASIQRYGDADITLIAEAVATPYNGADTLALHVRGPGIDATVNGARAETYLYAASTTTFALKSKHKAMLVAQAVTTGATPHYVRIWALCEPNF